MKAPKKRITKKRIVKKRRAIKKVQKQIRESVKLSGVELLCLEYKFKNNLE
jgi:hypothetical protein